MEKHNRRTFLRSTGIGIAAGAIAPRLLAGEASALKAIHLPENTPFKLGLASYTTRAFTLDQTISMTQRVNLKHISLKSFHLPLDSSENDCKAASDKIKAAGIDFYSAGVIYMNKKEEVDQAFNYAKACGIRMIVGVPAVELLSYAESMIKQYNIMLAIHNHGPGDLVYPAVTGVYEKIVHLDKRMGICMDIGHTVRLDRDLVSDLNQCFDRILDIHIKDVDKRTADGATLEIGRGVIDIPGFLKELKRLNYKGILSFEYEKDEKDPLPGLAESVGYVNGVLDCRKTQGG
jgi:sugar phosphate isomerase/epimerase